MVYGLDEDMLWTTAVCIWLPMHVEHCSQNWGVSHGSFSFWFWWLHIMDCVSVIATSQPPDNPNTQPSSSRSGMHKPLLHIAASQTVPGQCGLSLLGSKCRRWWLWWWQWWCGGGCRLQWRLLWFVVELDVAIDLVSIILRCICCVHSPAAYVACVHGYWVPWPRHPGRFLDLFYKITPLSHSYNCTGTGIILMAITFL